MQRRWLNIKGRITPWRVCSAFHAGIWNKTRSVGPRLMVACTALWSGYWLARGLLYLYKCYIIGSPNAEKHDRKRLTAKIHLMLLLLRQSKGHSRKAPDHTPTIIRSTSADMINGLSLFILIRRVFRLTRRHGGCPSRHPRARFHGNSVRLLI